MCGNSIAVIELAIVRRQYAAVFELYAPSVYTAHRHQFPVSRTKATVTPIAAEKKPIAGRDL